MKVTDTTPERQFLIELSETELRAIKDLFGCQTDSMFVDASVYVELGHAIYDAAANALEPSDDE